LEVTPIRCRLDVPEALPELPFDLSARRGLFLAVKEALNNAAKHSQAKELFLRLQLAQGRVSVVIEDNGRGFDPAQAGQDRNGLKNMGQRLRELGGEFRLTSRPGAGCRVELAMPVNPGAAEPAGNWQQFWARLRKRSVKTTGPLH
jgi:signal transduction histidine kinase